MKKESRQINIVREIGAWLKPRFEKHLLKFPSELPGGTMCRHGLYNPVVRAGVSPLAGEVDRRNAVGE